ncbi:hypothetical protein TWF703_000344 [Orbilia oligospora]|uniref:Uncharacterized protein n=1 Tax=Orbilia oligospora TaxID=2813651 RepID=A0A7C8PC10_ORBOL|nr:hypothetical protein TWF703_000344 [Orbilia oligospora]
MGLPRAEIASRCGFTSEIANNRRNEPFHKVNPPREPTSEEQYVIARKVWGELNLYSKREKDFGFGPGENFTLSDLCSYLEFYVLISRGLIKETVKLDTVISHFSHLRACDSRDGNGTITDEMATKIRDWIRPTLSSTYNLTTDMRDKVHVNALEFFEITKYIWVEDNDYSMREELLRRAGDCQFRDTRAPVECDLDRLQEAYQKDETLQQLYKIMEDLEKVPDQDSPKELKVDEIVRARRDIFLRKAQIERMTFKQQRTEFFDQIETLDINNQIEGIPVPQNRVKIVEMMGLSHAKNTIDPTLIELLTIYICNASWKKAAAVHAAEKKKRKIKLQDDITSKKRTLKDSFEESELSSNSEVTTDLDLHCPLTEPAPLVFKAPAEVYNQQPQKKQKVLSKVSESERPADEKGYKKALDKKRNVRDAKAHAAAEKDIEEPDETGGMILTKIPPPQLTPIPDFREQCGKALHSVEDVLVAKNYIDHTILEHYKIRIPVTYIPTLLTWQSFNKFHITDLVESCIPDDHWRGRVGKTVGQYSRRNKR